MDVARDTGADPELISTYRLASTRDVVHTLIKLTS